MDGLVEGLCEVLCAGVECTCLGFADGNGVCIAFGGEIWGDLAVSAACGHGHVSWYLSTENSALHSLSML